MRPVNNCRSSHDIRMAHADSFAGWFEPLFAINVTRYLLQLYCNAVSARLCVALNQMPDCKYWVFTAVWLKVPFSTMTPRHRVIGSRPLEPWIRIRCALETSGTDYIVTRRYTRQSGALKSWSDLARDVANWSLQLLKWRREGRGNCKVPSQQSETRKSRSSDGILNWIRSKCVVTVRWSQAEPNFCLLHLWHRVVQNIVCRCACNTVVLLCHSLIYHMSTTWLFTHYSNMVKGEQGGWTTQGVTPGWDP